MRNTTKLITAVLILLSISAGTAFADSDWSGTGYHPVAHWNLVWQGTWEETPDPDQMSGDWQVAGYFVAWLCDFKCEIWPAYTYTWDYQTHNGIWMCEDEEGPSGTFQIFFVDDYCYGTWTIDGVEGTGSLTGSKE